MSGNAPGAHDTVHIAAASRFNEQCNRQGLGLPKRVQELREMGFEIFYLSFEYLISSGMGLSIKQLYMIKEEPKLFFFSLLIDSKIRVICLKGNQKFLLREGGDLKSDVERERIESSKLAYRLIKNPEGDRNASFLFATRIGIFEKEKIASIVFDLKGGLSSRHYHGPLVQGKPT
jgi:hypothetical protein